MADANVKHEVYEIFEIKGDRYAINGMVEFAQQPGAREGAWQWDSNSFRVIEDKTQKDFEPMFYMQHLFDEASAEAITRWIAKND